MAKSDDYRKKLRGRTDWESYLLSESRLPGTRANIERAQAVAEEGNEELFGRYLSYDPVRAPAHSPHEFLAFCGVLGLGRLLAEGKMEILSTLREYASDPRWRIREAVAMALQRFGEVSMESLLLEMRQWSKGTLLEKRAAAAALCEPKLLREETHILSVLRMLDDITASIEHDEERKSDEFKALRKGLGYCWSVVVAALPEKGKKVIERWFSCSDKDVLWIMRENLKKSRLARMDVEWVKRWKEELGMT